MIRARRGTSYHPSSHPAPTRTRRVIDGEVAVYDAVLCLRMICTSAARGVNWRVRVGPPDKSVFVAPLVAATLVGMVQ